MTKLHKCFTETSRIINSGKLPKPLKTLAQVRDFQFAFNRLSAAGLATTIIPEVSSLFKRYGFVVQETDVGFNIIGE